MIEKKKEEEEEKKLICYILITFLNRIEILCQDINVHIPHAPHISKYSKLQENWGKVRFKKCQYPLIETFDV